MNRAKQLAQIFFFTSGGLLFCVLTYYTVLAGPGVYKASLAGKDVKETAQRVNAMSYQAAIMTGTLRHTINKVNDAADEQISYLKAQEKSTLKTTDAVTFQVTKIGEIADSAKVAIDTTSDNLNGKLVPKISAAVETANATVAKLGVTADSATQAIAEFNLKWVSNPELVSDVRTTMGNVSEGSGHVNGILADAHHEADRLVAPTTFWGKIKGAVVLAAHVGAIVIVRLL